MRPVITNALRLVSRVAQRISHSIAHRALHGAISLRLVIFRLTWVLTNKIELFERTFFFMLRRVTLRCLVCTREMQRWKLRGIELRTADSPIATVSVTAGHGNACKKLNLPVMDYIAGPVSRLHPLWSSSRCCGAIVRARPIAVIDSTEPDPDPVRPGESGLETDFPGARIGAS